jgi:gluconolactonase
MPIIPTGRLLSMLLRSLCLPAAAGFLLLLPALAAAEDKPQATQTVKIKDLQLTVPESWEQEKPESRFRVGQFQIPPVDGDKEPAELVIFWFEGGGGGIDPNLKRWIGEVSPEGRKMKLSKGKSKQGTYYLSDLTGTYNKRVGPPVAGKTKAMPGSRVLGVILEVTDTDPYFFKLSGPEKTVTAAEKAFKKSFGADPDSEEKYELP